MRLKEPEKVCYECRYYRAATEGYKSTEIVCGHPSGETKYHEFCFKCGKAVEEAERTNFVEKCNRCFDKISYKERRFTLPSGTIPTCRDFEEPEPRLTEVRAAIRELQDEIEMLKAVILNLSGE